MSEAAKFFDGFKKGMVGELFTSAIAKIEAYDAKLNKADITLLPGGELIKSVPVGIQQTSQFYIRMPYKKGDHVLVVFSHRDIDPIMFDNGKIPSERMLSIDDAIIVAGINLYTKPLPVADADKLVIGQKDGAAKITMGNGTIDFIGSVRVNGTALVAGGVSF